MLLLAQKLSQYLTLLVLLPCILLGGVMSFDISVAYKAMNNAYEAEYNAFLSHAILNVVHETQKERGMSAAYIASESSAYNLQLNEQRN